MQRELELLERKAARERAARVEAESLLEAKSRENYEASHRLSILAEQLRKQAELTSAIIETAADGIIVFDGLGQIISANPSAERIFNFSREDFAKLNVADLFDAIHSQQSGGHELHITGEYIGKRSNGDTFPLEWMVSRVASKDFEVWTAFVHDTTQRKQLQLQLAHAQKLESVGLLAAGVAHEINTPIQFVGDNVHFLSESFDEVQRLLADYRELETAVRCNLPVEEILPTLEATAKEVDLNFLVEEIPSAIAEAMDGITRVAGIIKAMKEFSHPGLEKRCRIDLNRAIESTIAVARNEWKYVAKMEVDLDPNLPPVNCYPGELNQAILNLIINAAQAVAEAKESSPRHKEFWIRVTTEQIDDQVAIEVSDSGIGISQDNIDKIFTPFFTTKDIGKGTGQGLAIVQSVIARKHGGIIEVDSESGVGSTFRVILRIGDSIEPTPAFSEDAPLTMSD